MKRLYRVLCVLCAFCLSFLPALPVSAREEYTYTIRFFAGRQGSFAGGEEVIVFEGRQYGERVNFSQSAVTLHDNSKYYVKGIRESGKDNSESTQASSFLVTGDRDYVVAYGILGDSTSYTIYYVDGDGNALLPSETYYGNVGDRPVIAYLYIEGWQPQAYNLTRTLKKDPAENVFTFVYSKATAAQPGPQDPMGPNTPPNVSDILDGDVTTDRGITIVPAQQGQGDAQNNGDTQGENGADASDDGTADLGDGQLPLGLPDEVKDLDEKKLSVSSILTIAADARLLGIPLPVIVVLAMGAVAVAWYFLIMKGRKKEEESKQ